MHKYEHRSTKDAGARGVQLLLARLVLMHFLLQEHRITIFKRSLEFLCYGKNPFEKKMHNVNAISARSVFERPVSALF
jgi:hypothetical protein